MDILKLVMAAVFGIVGLICTIIILIDAFQDEIWKGALGLLCGLYLIYYGLFEFEHEQKWLLVLGMIFGDGIAMGILSL